MIHAALYALYADALARLPPLPLLLSLSLLSDFCPFAQRTWLALLEKEDDPHNPQRFMRLDVN